MRTTAKNRCRLDSSAPGSMTKDPCSGVGRAVQSRPKRPSLYRSILLGACLVALLIFRFEAAAQDAGAEYRIVTRPCNLTFPRDHGAHPGFRTEWWYYTGNLQTDGQRSFGFQLTVFRRRIRPPATQPVRTESTSRWRTRQIYFGHAAVTDISGGRHLTAESIARGALGLSGVRQSGLRTTVSLNKWSIDIRPGIHRLQAVTDDFSLDLQLRPQKPPVLHGDRGYSRKGDSEERASCYYSFTRLQTAGRIRIGEMETAVTGASWMDHEFSTTSLQAGIVGWDWFSLQLDNGMDLMIYLLRQEEGRYHPASSSTLVDADGSPVHLTAPDFTVSVRDTWKSPQSQATYPSAWAIRIAPAGIDLIVRTRLEDQEMVTPATAGITYWEGSVAAAGTAKGEPVTATGYVELTGYAGTLEALK